MEIWNRRYDNERHIRWLTWVAILEGQRIQIILRVPIVSRQNKSRRIFHNLSPYLHRSIIYAYDGVGIIWYLTDHKTLRFAT